MRKVLLMFLMLLLPLQWSAASAAQYCLHEPSAAAQKHVGHHDHEHQEKVSEPLDDRERMAFDADCATCIAHVVHATSPGLKLVSSLGNAQVFRRHQSLVPDFIPESPFRPPLSAFA